MFLAYFGDVIALVVMDTFDRYLKSNFFFADTCVAVPVITRAVLVGSPSFFLHYNQKWSDYNVNLRYYHSVRNIFSCMISIFTHFGGVPKINSTTL